MPKKVKKAAAHHKKSSPKRGHNFTGNGVYWWGIHIHHVGLGVAAIGTLMIVVLSSQLPH